MVGERTLRWGATLMIAVVAAIIAGCVTTPAEESPRASDRLGAASGGAPDGSDDRRIDEFVLQELVMNMADEYMTALAETFYQATDDRTFTPRQRRFAASIVRSGIVAAVSIGSSASPDTALLDLLVVVTLQRSAFERIWIPREWPLGAEGIVTRLRATEDQLWADASRVLSETQKDELRVLIDAWIEENPDRRLVELVRFLDFADTRNISSLAYRERAMGLLRELNEATRAIDEARLFGERALWISTRLPTLAGVQAEATAFRVVGEPEVAEIRQQIEAFRSYTERLTEQVEGWSGQVDEKLGELDDLVTSQRIELIEGFSEAVGREREQLIDGTFEHFARERTATFDELERRSDTLQGILTDLQETVSSTSELAVSIRGTVDAVDRVVARFDAENRNSEPLDLEKVRSAAVAIGEAADRLTIALEQANDSVGKLALDEPVGQLKTLADGILTTAFWRTILVVAFALCGLAVLKLIPARAPKGTGTG